MPSTEERAFTRRTPGVNPIALELDRLAEQQALATLGNQRRIGSPPDSEPRNALGQTQGEERDADPFGVPLKQREDNYTSLLGRMHAANTASGRVGLEAELAMVPDTELASSADMADAQIGNAIESGRAYINEEDGGLYSVDPDPDRVLGRNLDIFNEFQRRTGGTQRAGDAAIQRALQLLSGASK